MPQGWSEAVPEDWPSIVVRGFCCQALSASQPPVTAGGQPGFVAPVSRSRMVWVWGTQHGPHTARSCEQALCAVGVAGGHPRGGGVPCAVVMGV